MTTTRGMNNERRVSSGSSVRTFASYAQRDAQFGSEQRTAPPATVEWDATLANSVTLIGNCGSDPELRVLPSGKMVCEVSMASGARHRANGEVVCLLRPLQRAVMTVAAAGERERRVFPHGKRQKMTLQTDLGGGVWLLNPSWEGIDTHGI